MTDCNLEAGQPPASHTNMNSIHPLQGNAQVTQDFVGGPSTTLEVLESACGDGSSTHMKKFNLKTCILSKSFKPSDRIVSSVTHRTYPCINVLIMRVLI